ncbi:MAG: penicillin-binding transpeptidase domain-containing protein [Peptoniphilus sp.]|nr:penicillin-binding transpeptidase domain-containing protein [Peptoniphilus sp.]MDD7363334.1 penicillin-binding transpeptidase domain-containing protein [Bacillota bacterium]MDY6044253.1 penicillin-binding transpeptidase domain-containing protein [Peptoniphilus sp.]
MNKSELRRIVVLLAGLVVLFLACIIYLTYFYFFQAETVKNHPSNRRGYIEEAQIKRGDIYDRNGELLATSEGEPGNYHREYSYPILYSHIIGYSHSSLGKSGLEASYNDYLLNRNGNRTLKELSNMIRDKKQDGNTLVLSVDTQVQSKARELLEENTTKGSIVVMNPKTGEIYAMVSLPDFNTMSIAEDWNDLQQNKAGALLDRSINGRYPPGSTFKVITAASLLEQNHINLNYEDTGSQVIDGREFKNDSGASYGTVDLKEAISKSINTYFVEKGSKLGKDALGETADKFYFNQKIPFDLPVTRSVFDYKKHLPKTTLAASAIGQGDVLVTPLHMAMVASAVANDGKMMEPHLVTEVDDPKGTAILKKEPQVLSESVPPEIAKKLNDYMISVVEDGTGKRAALGSTTVAGKTGTAENSSGSDHAWFIGYAPANDPEVAVSVIVEEAGRTGGRVAAPIARDIIVYALNNIDFSQTPDMETEEDD